MLFRSYQEGIEEGIVKGIEKGRAEGKAEGKVEGELGKALQIARNLLVQGMEVKTISLVTGLTEAEVKNLANQK